MQLSRDKTKVIQICILVGSISSYGVLIILINGITGYSPDILYHLLRIEGIKESLLTNNFIPRIYPNFMSGFGYGSPMFYPDVFLSIPALFRIIGLSVEVSYKLFILIITIAGAISTFFSFRYITRSHTQAIVGTYLQMLSLYFIATAYDRAGISEYVALVFIPILFAAIYDFFEYSAKKWYLFVIAFSGMMLSHIITLLLAVIVTFFLFVIMLFFEKGRKAVFNVNNILKLLISIGIIWGITAFFFLTIIEQMMCGTQFRYMYPTQLFGVSSNVQKLYTMFLQSGHFNRRAYVGIGAPILIVGLSRSLCKTKDKWENVFLLSGLGLWLSASVPFIWDALSKTFLNMIQFPYRVYGLALCMMVCGCIIFLKDNEKDHKKAITIGSYLLIIASLVLAIREIVYIDPVNNRMEVSESTLVEESYNVGQGEWLPVDVGGVENLPDPGKIVGTDIVYSRDEHSTNGFFIAPEKGTYTMPLIGYKGYSAYVETEYGSEEAEIVYDKGLLQVSVNSGGKVVIKYTGTLVQKMGVVITFITTVGLIGLWILRKIRHKGTNENAIIEV